MFSLKVNEETTIELFQLRDKEAQGKGIVSNCVKTVVNYAFTHLELNKVEIHVAKGNARSRAVPERVGFVQERTSRDGQWLYDHYEDVIAYSLLRREWSKSHAKQSV